MKDRLEVELNPDLHEIYLKHYFNIDPPLPNGDRVGLRMWVLPPEAAFELGTKLLAAYDKTNG